MAITVRVGRLPGEVRSFAFEDGATVADALSEAGLDRSGYEIRRNGASTTPSTELADGDTVLLTRQIKGNQDVVRAGRLPGEVRSYAVDHGSTVGDVLEQAEIETAGYEVRLNGASTTLSAEVSDGDTILLTRQIKGN